MAKRPDNQELIKAITESHGNVTHAAGKVGVCRQTLAKWIKEDEELSKAHHSTKESFKDKAETMLQTKVLQGDNTCLIFYLKTQAKDRGYIEKQQIEQSGEIKMYGVDAPVDDV